MMKPILYSLSLTSKMYKICFIYNFHSFFFTFFLLLFSLLQSFYKFKGCMIIFPVMNFYGQKINKKWRKERDISMKKGWWKTHIMHTYTCIIYGIEKYNNTISKLKENKYLQREELLQKTQKKKWKVWCLKKKKNMQHRASDKWSCNT